MTPSKKNSSGKRLFYIALLGGACSLNSSFAQTVVSWTNTGSSTAWLTNANWSTNAYATTGNIAQFNNAGTASTSGINMNTLAGALSLAGIEVTSLRTTNNLSIGNSSSVNGTLTLTGGMINSVPNTIIRNASSKNLTIQDFVGGTGTMGLGLANTTDNKIFLDGSGNITISDIISGPANCPVSMQGVGSGVINITGVANTFQGQISLLGSEAVFSADGSFGAVPSSVTPAAIVIDGGRMTANATYTLNANRGILLGNTPGTSISVKTSTSVLTYFGVMADKTTNGSWAKQGANMLQLGGQSVYTGSTAVNNGTVQIISGNDRLPVTTLLVLGQNANVGVFDLNGNNQQISGLASAAGTNSSANKNRVITNSTPSTLTINNATTYTYGVGTAANSGVISGAVTVTKNGTGIQVLGDINAYTGATMINAGELRFSPNAAEALSSSVWMNGGTLGTQGITMGTILTFSTLNVMDNSMISLEATNTHTLGFASSSAAAWTAAKTLTITGWQGTYGSAAGSSGTVGQIFVGSTATDLTASQLSQITFFDGVKYYPATLLSTGELVPYCPDPILSTVSSSSSICVGNSINLSVTSTGTVSPAFGWSGPNSFTSAVQNPTITSATSAASGTYIVTASNSCGTFTASAMVTVNALPSLSVSASATMICAGQTASITVSGANTYTWSTSSNSASITVTPTSSATYTVSGTQSGCTGNAIVSVSVNAAPSLSVSASSSSICAGQSASLTVSGAGTYTWSTGSNSASVTVTPTNSATYTVSGTQSGCSDSTTVMVTVNALPSLTVSSTSTLLCVGQTATITTSGATTYTWSTSSNSMSITVTPTTSTTYTVTGTNAASCSSFAVFTQSVSTCTGINNIEAFSTTLQIYPNPVKENLTIAFGNTGEVRQISVTDATGRQVLSVRSSEESLQIGTTSMAPGFYTVIVTSGNRVQMSKFIKE